MESDKLILSIYSKTWSRDSHGLFDYECTATKNKYIYVFGNTKIYRKQNEISQVANNNEVTEGSDVLFDTEYDKTKYSLCSPVPMGLEATEENISVLQDKIWMIIKSENSEQSSNVNSPNYEALNDYHKIKLNDIIKLGRVKYVITEIKTDEEQESSSSVFDLIYQAKIPAISPEQVTCKICLGDGETEDNPFISICACKGSVSLLHLNCLKQWINSKLVSKINNDGTIVNYSIKTFNCELCKQPYPLRFSLKDQVYNLIDIARPEDKEYFIMESLTQVKDQNNFKSIHVIQLKKDEKIMLVRL